MDTFKENVKVIVLKRSQTIICMKAGCLLYLLLVTHPYSYLTHAILPKCQKAKLLTEYTPKNKPKRIVLLPRYALYTVILTSRVLFNRLPLTLTLFDVWRYHRILVIFIYGLFLFAYINQNVKVYLLRRPNGLPPAVQVDSKFMCRINFMYDRWLWP